MNDQVQRFSSGDSALVGFAEIDDGRKHHAGGKPRQRGINPPKLLLSPTTTGPRFRVVTCDIDVQVTNNLLAIHERLDNPLSEDQWSDLAEWLRSDSAQQQWQELARIYAGGLRKLEPRAARSIRLPASLVALLSSEGPHAPRRT